MKIIPAETTDPLCDVASWSITQAKLSETPVYVRYAGRLTKVYPESHAQDIIDKCLLLKQLSDLAQSVNFDRREALEERMK